MILVGIPGKIPKFTKIIVKQRTIILNAVGIEIFCNICYF